VSGGSARSTRRHSVEFSQDLVLHGIGKSIFQHLTVNWNFNVLEMAFKTIHIAQGLSRTPLLFFPRSLTTRFSKNIPQRSNISKIGNPVHGQKQVEVSLFVSAGTVPGILVENGPRLNTWGPYNRRWGVAPPHQPLRSPGPFATRFTECDHHLPETYGATPTTELPSKHYGATPTNELTI
jgi:hypothetical protein